MIVGSLLLIVVAAGMLGGGLVADSNVLIAGSIGVSLLAGVVLYVGARQSAAALAGRRAVVPARSRAGTRRRRDSAGAHPVGVRDTGSWQQPRLPASETAVVPPVDDARDDTRGPAYRDPDTAEQHPVPRTHQDTADPSTAVGWGADFPVRPAGPSPSAEEPRHAEDSHHRYAESPRYDVPTGESPTEDTLERTSDPAGEEPDLDVALRRAVLGDSPGPDLRDHANTSDAQGDEEDPPDEPMAQPTSSAVTARVARLTADVLVVDGRPRYHLAGCVHLIGREVEPLPVNEAVELGFTPCALCDPNTALLAD